MEKMNSNTLFIICPTGITTRDMLKTSIMKYLNKDKTIKIVFFSPAASYPEYFNFENEDIKVERIFPRKINSLEYLLTKIRYNIFAKIKYSSTRDIALTKFCNEKGILIKFINCILTERTIKLFNIYTIVEKLQLFFYNDERYDKLFAYYNPKLVFFANPLINSVYPLLKSAKKAGILTVGYISSWDNITSKGILPVKLDNLIVWNLIMKKEAINYYDYPEKDIFISGVPQFDEYFTQEKSILSRNDFFRTINADVSKKLIVYTTGSSDFMTPCDPDIIGILDNYIRKNQLIYPAQILVRLHQGDTLERYKSLLESENILWDIPINSDAFPDKLDPNLYNIGWLGNIIFHSDIIINIASTITIEACCLNKPVINIAFDGYSSKDYYSSIKRYYDYEHYKRLISTGGVRIVFSIEELLKSINEYLLNPELDQDNRKKIVKEQCYFDDGKSGERIGRYILEKIMTV